MDTEYWLDFHLRKDTSDNIECPKCKIGRLHKKGEDFLIEETSSSKNSILRQDDKPQNNEYRFTGFLECNNTDCNEVYSICGYSQFFECEYPIIDTTNNNWELINNLLYRKDIPVFVFPPLHIIELKNKYPIEINDALLDSFKLFFADNEACANKIRIALELLLDELGVDQFGKKGENLALGIRIEKYKEVDEENSNLMKATKIIGNYGSHREKVSRQDVLDGYELLMAVLDDLYDNDSIKLKLKAEQIIKNKKPISKIKE